MRGQYANPVIVLDEVEKASGSTQFDPLAALYQLLEPETASAFRDEFIDVTLSPGAANEGSYDGPAADRRAYSGERERSRGWPAGSPLITQIITSSAASPKTQAR